MRSERGLPGKGLPGRGILGAPKVGLDFGVNASQSVSHSE